MTSTKVHFILWCAVLFLIALVSLISCDGEQIVVSEEKESAFPTTEYLIEVDSLSNLLDGTEKVQLLDVRKPTAYLNGHISGAQTIWRNQLTDSSYAYSGVALERAKLADTLGELGINSEDLLILYDGNGGSDAMRVWFLLYCYGHRNMKVLNGGWLKWSNANLKSTSGSEQTRNQTTFRFAVNQTEKMMCSKYDVQQALTDTNTILVDTRSYDEYSGKRQKVGASRHGRIPTSVHWDWGNAVNFESDYTLKSTKDLAYMLDSCNISAKKNIIVYCHTGVRSSHTYFVLTELLGYQHVSNYDGSWSEWSYWSELPITTDFEVPEITK